LLLPLTPTQNFSDGDNIGQSFPRNFKQPNLAVPFSKNYIGFFFFPKLKIKKISIFKTPKTPNGKFAKKKRGFDFSPSRYPLKVFAFFDA